MRFGLIYELQLPRPWDARIEARVCSVVNLQPHEVAASELAIDCEIEQSEVADPVPKLEPDPDCPDILRFQRSFLPRQTPLVPWNIRHDRLP